MLSATVFRLNRVGEPHRVTNISETGLCIVQAGALDVGSVVVVTIGQVEQVPADIVWVRAGLAGLKFHTPIDVARARLRRAAGQAAAAPSAGWMAELNDPYARRGGR